MLALYENIKKLRNKLGLNQTELAMKLGYADKSMIAKIEKGLIDLPQSKIIAFANVLNVSPSELMGWENDVVTEIPITFDDYFPLHYSTNLSAGTLEELLDSEPDAIVYVPIKYQMIKKRLHAFKVNGTSMNNIIADNSIVVAEDIQSALNLKDGQIVVAWVNGLATVKRLYVNGNQITLMPDSSDKSHQPIMINTDIDTVSIIGRVIWHMNPDDIEKYY